MELSIFHGERTMKSPYLNGIKHKLGEYTAHIVVAVFVIIVAGAGYHYLRKVITHEVALVLPHPVTAVKDRLANAVTKFDNKVADKTEDFKDKVAGRVQKIKERFAHTRNKYPNDE
jgi:hypothetical protein